MLVGVLYGLYIGISLYGYTSLKPYEKQQNLPELEDKKYISLIIPFKNEEKHLADLIESLKNQSLAKQYFETVLIDDHSEDSSAYIIQKHIENNSNIRILYQEKLKSGKKHALLKGISETSAELIVTSDADCIHNPFRLETILHYYLEFHPKMIIAPVIMTGNTFFQKIQRLEFVSLAGITAGAAGIKRPIICNGANLAYLRTAFETFENPLNLNEASGDDVFLLHQFKKKYRKDIHYLMSKQAFVFTQAEYKLSSFFKQRLRWASKSKSYKDTDTVTVSLLVFLINVLLPGLFALSLFNTSFLSFALLFFGLKMLTDFFFLFITSKFYKQRKLLIYFPLLSIVYPFYIVLTAISGLIKR